MKLKTIKFDKALNQAYFKQSLKRNDIELFKSNLEQLFKRINESETEEHNKNIVSDFLKNTFYKNKYEINTSGQKDLVIHKGNTSQTPVSVIIETKSPANKSEMIGFDKPNAKALHETIHYYLNERIINNNKKIKHLIITNIFDWFIFDAAEFEKYFYADKSFRNNYLEWNNKELAGTKTDWFYTEIAKPFVDNQLESMECVYINLLDYKEIIKNDEPENDNKLISLYKIISPEHLLKLPFANDYNKIDSGFYNELLHILGLEENKKNGKKLITRVKEKERQAGTLIENTIGIIQSLRRLNHIERPDIYGENEQEQLFSIALELNITWLNRILFLKLLEAQLIKYHKGNKNFAFLNSTKIRDFDELNELFFDVLAKKPQNRTTTVNNKFGELPYLNSSLFEQTKLEDNIAFISQLKDRLTLSTSKHTVLKDKQGKQRSSEIKTLEYLFDFLNAYSFANDDKAEIQDDSRTIINAAVLGLIFEKINGYKDGSFYTPGFITTYISHSALKNTLVTNFKKVFNKNITDFEQLKQLIDYTNKEQRKKANEIINSLKIIDPAVGSGHFLVSVLNELVALKSELRILQDKNGNRLRGIKIKNINDELLIINEETGEPFQYYVNNKHIPPTEIQEIQQTLFNEKRTLIENCLFGVDINPKSVLICRLRLWIELLKNSFYTPDSNFKYLETLPNIDINIKPGNSLISKFDTGLNIFERAAVNHLIKTYKINVDAYKSETDYDKKQNYKQTITNIKNELLKYAIPQDRSYKKYLKKSRELQNLVGIKPQNEAIKTQIVKLSNEAAKLEQKYKENYYKLYANSLEWAIDFPEILSEDGEFEGFDIVVGNPPYFSISKEPNLKKVSENYTIFKNTADIYTLFIERGMQILKPNGRLHFITSNKWLRASYGENLREYLLKNTTIEKIMDFNGLKIFDEATVDTGIIEIVKQKNGNKPVKAVRFDKTFDIEKDDIAVYFQQNKIELNNLTKDSWNLKSEKENAIKIKIESKGKPLKNWNINIYRGITTGLNEAFVIDGKTKEKLLKADSKNKKLIKPLLRGRDIKQYNTNFADLWIICIFPAQNINIENYISLKKYLSKFKTRLKSKPSNYKGNWQGRKTGRFKWYEIQDNTAYYPEFERDKIVFTKASQTKAFAYDNKGYYLQNTSYILTGKHLKYLLAVLNSKLITFSFLNFYQSGGVEGEITVQAMNRIPIPEITEENQRTATGIETYVNKILKLKETNSNADISTETEEIDKLIYQLYGLTEDEIKIIQSQSA